ncbi:ribose-phosphate diphosphokinase [Fructilactobacillus vespulae]|uniref:ribose-phosphate diphosphokinase n=1 Tax=Fructilactobacillus vespulae TaxID=1249630 RepID=UPI0039B3CC44
MSINTKHKPIIFALSSNKPLAEKISKVSGMPIGEATINQFSDGEIKISIDESIRGDDVYIIQSISDPSNDNLMELLIMIDAVRRTSAHTINVVMPFYGYARSNQKTQSRAPITAKLIASFLQNSSVDRVVALDLHAAQIQGFFDIPVDHLRSEKLISEYLKANGYTENAVIVAPDHNGVARARGVANRLDLPLAIIDNRDPEKKNHVPNTVIGDVKGKNTIIIDDMIVTGYNIKVSAEVLKKAGAKKVSGAVTHAVFADSAKENLSSEDLENVIVTDSIKIPDKFKLDKLTILTVSNLIGNALKLIQDEKTTHILF